MLRGGGMTARCVGRTGMMLHAAHRSCDGKYKAKRAITSALPDFRNLGILLRILLVVNVRRDRGGDRARAASRRMDALVRRSSALVQPILTCCSCSLLVRCSTASAARLPYRRRRRHRRARRRSRVGIVVSSTARPAARRCRRDAVLVRRSSCSRCSLTRGRCSATSTCAAARCRPRIAEARLQALQARIRPHFLFNSINAVLSLDRRSRSAPKPRSRTWPISFAC